MYDIKLHDIRIQFSIQPTNDKIAKAKRFRHFGTTKKFKSICKSIGKHIFFKIEFNPFNSLVVEMHDQ